MVGRLTVGFAVGVASVAAPLFAAEMAPSRLRGAFVSTYQLGITFGIFVAYLVDESSPADQTAATTWAIGAVNVLATLTVSASTAANHSNLAGDAGISTLVALVVYIASFAFSMGPIVWTMINEIYPRSVRGRAVSVATAANWFSAWLVSQFFLSLVDAIGESATFWRFAALCVVCLVWIVRKVPETRGRTLEEIEEMWVHGDGAPPGRDGPEGRTGAWGTAGSGSS